MDATPSLPRTSSIALLFALLRNSVQSYPLGNDGALLTQTPMIITHDAASGYLGGGLTNAWTDTQGANLVQQLDCGARAFDARPEMHRSYGLIWHHGSVIIQYPFKRSVEDIIGWCARNPSELVLLPISECDGDGCMAAVIEVLASMRVKIVDDCGALKGLTYGDAKRFAALPGGGALLAVLGPTPPSGQACSNGNYDSSLTCVDSLSDKVLESCGNTTGMHTLDSAVVDACTSHLAAGAPSVALGRRSFDCWKSSGKSQIAVDRLLSYLDRVSAGGLSDGMFTQAQALWQESATSVIVGTWRHSSLVKDEVNSGINQIIVAAVRSGRWSNINLLEVNNVCDEGPQLLEALRNNLRPTLLV